MDKFVGFMVTLCLLTVGTECGRISKHSIRPNPLIRDVRKTTKRQELSNIQMQIACAYWDGNDVNLDGDDKFANFQCVCKGLYIRKTNPESCVKSFCKNAIVDPCSPGTCVDDVNDKMMYRCNCPGGEKGYRCKGQIRRRLVTISDPKQDKRRSFKSKKRRSYDQQKRNLGMMEMIEIEFDAGTEKKKLLLSPKFILGKDFKVLKMTDDDKLEEATLPPTILHLLPGHVFTTPDGRASLYVSRDKILKAEGMLDDQNKLSYDIKASRRRSGKSYHALSPIHIHKYKRTINVPKRRRKLDVTDTKDESVRREKKSRKQTEKKKEVKRQTKDKKRQKEVKGKKRASKKGLRSKRAVEEDDDDDDVSREADANQNEPDEQTVGEQADDDKADNSAADDDDGATNNKKKRNVRRRQEDDGGGADDEPEKVNSAPFDEGSSSFPPPPDDDDINPQFPPPPDDDDIITKYPLPPDDEDIITKYPPPPDDEDIITKYPPPPDDEDIITKYPPPPDDEDIITKYPPPPDDDDIILQFPPFPPDGDKPPIPFPKFEPRFVTLEIWVIYDHQNAQAYADAIDKLIAYLATFWYKVSSLYEEATNCPKIRLALSGIILASQTLTDSLLGAQIEDGHDMEETEKNLQDWLDKSKDKEGMPDITDAIIFQTAAKLYNSAKSEEYPSYTNPKKNCPFLSVLTDKAGDYSSYTHAAHALHSMFGAELDTNEPHCTSEDGYLLYADKLGDDLKKLTFSPCSVTKMEEQVMTADRECLVIFPLYYFPEDLLQGSLISLKEQCEQLMDDPNADVVGPITEDICKEIICRVGETTKPFDQGALDGTPCGFQKACVQKECVTIPRPTIYDMCARTGKALIPNEGSEINVCQELQCVGPDGKESGELLRPYEGTPCGTSQRMCINGKCMDIHMITENNDGVDGVGSVGGSGRGDAGKNADPSEDAALSDHDILTQLMLSGNDTLSIEDDGDNPDAESPDMPPEDK